jgi:hypothetical protein
VYAHSAKAVENKTNLCFDVYSIRNVITKPNMYIYLYGENGHVWLESKRRGVCVELGRIERGV